MPTKILALIFTTFLSVSAFADYQISCVDLKAKKPGPALLSAMATSMPSRRLISDLTEARSTTDTETLPSFLVSQYKADAGEVYILLDDASPAGNLIAELDLKAIGKKKGDKALWRYQGTYKRFDAGRQLNLKVECAVTQ